MFWGRKKEVVKKDFNEGYQEFLDHPEILLLSVDEDYIFEACHPREAQCLPLRIINTQAKKLLDQDDILYVYANKKGTASEASDRLCKLGFKVYNLGSIVDFRGPLEGTKVKAKRSKHKDHNY